jgi:UDP-galactopyranose mutase
VARVTISPESPPRIVIIGAGPCGLACARELERLGHRNWLVLERSDAPGGLASSVLDPAGFTWDLGGHVVFSHFGEFDALLEEVMKGDVLRHERSSYIRFGERWVPYPFQNNLRYLPSDVRDECLSGLAAATGAPAGADFAAWMRGMFGEGITRHFMRPYNAKVWAAPLDEMSSDWIAERVSVVDYERALRNVQEGRDDKAWGPNNTFVFPSVGGTGEIYRRVALRLEDRIRYGCEVAEIDWASSSIEIAGGPTERYDALVSTMPLDRLVAKLRPCPQELAAAAGRLRHNGVYMVGVGYESPCTAEKSWMYFPDPDVPFYRVTNFAKYSAANVPEADSCRYCSFMTETAYSSDRPVERLGIEERVEAGLRSAGVVDGGPKIASLHVEQIEYAYPIPTLDRDRALETIQPWLMARTILSRGRFGSWRYEIGNMDHAVKMGVDAARALVNGADEELWTLPVAQRVHAG